METIIANHLRQIKDPGQRVGATYVPGEGTYVRLWAPFLDNVGIEWQGRPRHKLDKDGDYFHGFFPDAGPGDRYYFYYNDGEGRIADPASRAQPDGVFGASMVLADDYGWRDHKWAGVPFKEWVIYEIHTGAYSPRHDFQGIIDDLPRLKDLGITTIELMPVSPFSGTRNWGYDGVFPHAVQHSYGGPEELKKLVDACHIHGLAIILDVVYNHLGPEGNVLFQCGPYVRDKYLTPWGDAINFDGPGSDEVRRYFLQSAWQWLTEYHFDGLRLDAVQTIYDDAPVTFLEELSFLKQAAEEETGRELALIAESNMNDPWLVKPYEEGGTALEAHWADDLHHTLHVALTGEDGGYYQDYTGGLAQLAGIYERKVAYNGQYSPYRQRFHGRSYDGVPPHKLVVSAQNHDQIGNRAFGERLSQLVSFEKLKLAAACVLLSPFTPMLFMGEEAAVKNPFLYFVSHESRALKEAVRHGRKEEWESFKWEREPPDPSAPDTFEQCVLQEKDGAGHDGEAMNAYYRQLISVSKTLRGHEPAVKYDSECAFIILDYAQAGLRVVFSFSPEDNFYDPEEGEWHCVLQSVRFQKGGDFREICIPGLRLNIAPFSVSLLRRKNHGK